MKFLFYSAILLACVFTSCKEKDTKPVGPLVVNKDSTEISTTVCGKGDTTLLFIHGWCINKTYWEGQAKHFCDRYKVVTVDLPGFGESGKNRVNWNFDNYTNDINAVIDQLKLKNVVLIGHSMSGDIILAMSARHPENIAGIIGIDNLHEPGGPMPEEQQKQMDGFFSLLRKSFDSMANVSMRSILFQPTTDSAVVNRVMNNIYAVDSSVATDVLWSYTQISEQEKQVMPQLNHKLYLVNSDVMPVKADSLNKYCRHGFSLQTVHATGHYPMIEKPEEFNAALEKTLSQISQDKKN